MIVLPKFSDRETEKLIRDKALKTLNPEIKKFWEHSGYRVSCSRATLSDDSGWIRNFCIVKDNCWIDWIAKTNLITTAPFVEPETPPQIDHYLFERKKVSEREMLKIVRLKAFA